MRITVGGILLVGAMVAGGYWVTGPEKRDWIIEKSVDAKKQVKSLVSFFQSASDINKESKSVDGKNDASSPNLPPLESVPIPNQEKPVEPVVDKMLAPETPKPSPVASPKPAKKTEATKKKPAKKSQKLTRKKPTTSVKKPAAKPATTSTAGDDNLIGSYVAVELNTGRKVMGILESKTATNYRIQLPGLGPFDYPASNVKSIKAAK